MVDCHILTQGILREKACLLDFYNDVADFSKTASNVGNWCLQFRWTKLGQVCLQVKRPGYEFELLVCLRAHLCV